MVVDARYGDTHAFPSSLSISAEYRLAPLKHFYLPLEIFLKAGNVARIIIWASKTEKNHPRLGNLMRRGCWESPQQTTHIAKGAAAAGRGVGSAAAARGEDWELYFLFPSRPHPCCLIPIDRFPAAFCNLQFYLGKEKRGAEGVLLLIGCSRL